MRTWAPLRETPVLQYYFSWKQVTAITGVSCFKIYFKLYAGTIKQEQVVDFLRHLLRLLRAKVLVIWDGLRSHKGRLVKKFVKVKREDLKLPFFQPMPPN